MSKNTNTSTTTMNLDGIKIEVIRTEPLDLPADVVCLMSGLYSTAPKYFTAFAFKEKNRLYINNSLPENDVEKMIEVMTSPEQYILEDDTAEGQFMEYVYSTYGYAAYDSISKLHSRLFEVRSKQRAGEMVQSIIPAIEQLVESGMFDENMILGAWNEGRNRADETPLNVCSLGDVYVYCLGYLEGKGALKEESEG